MLYFDRKGIPFHSEKIEMTLYPSFRISYIYQGILSSVSAIIESRPMLCNVFFVHNWVGFVDNIKVL